MFTLYHGPAAAANNTKCLIVLAEKSIRFQSRYVDLLKFEQHEPEFLAINPEGQTPVLDHDGRIITHSSVINEYLEDIGAGETNLRPTDPYEASIMRRWNKYIDEQVFETVSTQAWHRFMGERIAAIEDAAFEALIQRIPLARQRAKWRSAREGFPEIDLSRGRDKIIEAADLIEAQLAVTPWLAGDRYSLADINFYAVAGSHWGQVFDELTDERYPRTAEWRERMSSRPAVIAALGVKPNEINF